MPRLTEDKLAWTTSPLVCLSSASSREFFSSNSVTWQTGMINTVQSQAKPVKTSTIMTRSTSFCNKEGRRGVEEGGWAEAWWVRLRRERGRLSVADSHQVGGLVGWLVWGREAGSSEESRAAPRPTLSLGDCSANHQSPGQILGACVHLP